MLFKIKKYSLIAMFEIHYKTSFHKNNEPYLSILKIKKKYLYNILYLNCVLYIF